MSSTYRTKKELLTSVDYYVTPQRQIEIFLKAFARDCDIFNRDNLFIVDPCAGGDSKHDMSYPAVIKRLYGYDVVSIDIRPDSLAMLKDTNYLQYRFLKHPDVIITNPPFNIAMPIIEKALNDVIRGGYVIMLLRLNFFESRSRFEFFKKYRPKYCYVHHERMSFSDDGKRDSIAYCHMVFKKGYNGKYTKLRVI